MQERDKLLYTTVSALYRGDMNPLNMDSLYLIGLIYVYS
jgi:hypothetical protein